MTESDIKVIRVIPNKDLLEKVGNRDMYMYNIKKGQKATAD